MGDQDRHSCSSVSIVVDCVLMPARVVCVVGLMVAGPALAVVGAVGGAVVAATNKGDVGGVRGIRT